MDQQARVTELIKLQLGSLILELATATAKSEALTAENATLKADAKKEP